MRYFFLILVVYFVFKSIGKMLKNLKIVEDNSDDVKGPSTETQNRLRVDESEIEDADFKELD